MLYFGAHWCAPCRQLAPILRSFYTKVHEDGHPIEIVFVSLDRGADKMQEYYLGEQGDWVAIHYDDPIRTKLPDKYKVRGIPSLFVVNRAGDVVVDNNECIQTVVAVSQGRDMTSTIKDWRNRAGDWTVKGTAHKLGGGEAKKEGMSQEELKAERRRVRLERIARMEKQKEAKSKEKAVDV